MRQLLDFARGITQPFMQSSSACPILTCREVKPHCRQTIYHTIKGKRCAGCDVDICKAKGKRKKSRTSSIVRVQRIKARTVVTQPPTIVPSVLNIVPQVSNIIQQVPEIVTQVVPNIVPHGVPGIGSQLVSSIGSQATSMIPALRPDDTLMPNIGSQIVSNIGSQASSMIPALRPDDNLMHFENRWLQPRELDTFDRTNSFQIMPGIVPLDDAPRPRELEFPTGWENSWITNPLIG